jgi:ssDNA-binding Zn-finger/Zn-ribbon topoisomerase 1
MNAGRVTKLVIALLALAGAGVLFARWATQERSQYEDFPEGTFWVCTNVECQHEFTLSLEKVAAFYAENPDADMLCPKCGQPAVRATRCPFCEHSFPRVRGAGPIICPHCNRELPKATDSLGRITPQ